MPEALDELIAICRKTRSFGETLYNLMVETDVTQKELGFRIKRSKSDISRLINNNIPDKFEVHDVERIGQALGCQDVQLATLVRSFVCHVLRSRGLW
jgi:hypothetical protein